MVFSSQIFLFYFLGLALLLYYAAPRFMKQGVLALLSYVFYGWWNPWFTLLMLLSTVIDYGCGKMITGGGPERARRRRLGLTISVISNLALLGFFKYAAFATENINGVMRWLGLGHAELPPFLLEIVLPVGISFYTFQSMSYSIDLYRGHAPPARSFVDFACYVSMFPQLVAGPIVRYGAIATQLVERRHSVEGFVRGLTRFNFGFAKKILLANPMGEIADLCFDAGGGALSAPMAWLGVTAFTFQIYFDFSGYSDMAVGLGRMFGFRLPENFDSPYRSGSITEFWGRWHISLSSFLRDYLYIPLGGNRLGPGRTYVNLMVVMLLGGLWHGAAWTFLVWGGIHGAMLALERFMGKKPFYSRLPLVLRVGFTFSFLLITFVIFRSDSFAEAGRYLEAMFGSGDSAPAAELLAAQVLRPANLFFFAICAAGIWGVPNTVRILERLTVAKAAGGLILFGLSTAMMFRQGFNPFLYFQF